MLYPIKDFYNTKINFWSNFRGLNLVDFERIRLLLQPALLRVCIILSIVTPTIIFLSSFAVLVSLGSIGTILLISSVVFWTVYFILLSFLNDSYKQLRSLQSSGGDILQLATTYALKDTSCLTDFTMAQRALEIGDYVIAAQKFASLAEKEIPAGAVNEVVALIRSAHFSAAREALKRGLKQTRRGHITLRAALWNNLGVIEARQGRPNEAQICYKRSIEIFRKQSDRRGSGDALLNAANSSANQGDFFEATKQLEESEKSYPRQLSSFSKASGLACRGYIDSEHKDDFGKSLETLNESLSIFGSENCNIGRAHVLMLRGNIFFTCDKLEDALNDYSEASLLSVGIGDPLGEASAQVNVGNVRFRQGDYEAALEDYESALGVHESLENILGQARTCTNIGSVLVRLGRKEDALKSLFRAREFYASIKAQGRHVDTVEKVIFQIEEEQ